MDTETDSLLKVEGDNILDTLTNDQVEAILNALPADDSALADSDQFPQRPARLRTPGQFALSSCPTTPSLHTMLLSFMPLSQDPAMLSFQYGSLPVEPSHLRRYVLEVTTPDWQPLPSDHTSSIPANTRFEIVLPSTVPSHGEHQIVPIYRYDLDTDGHEFKATYMTVPNTAVEIMQGFSASTVPEFAKIQAFGTGWDDVPTGNFRLIASSYVGFEPLRGLTTSQSISGHSIASPIWIRFPREERDGQFWPSKESGSALHEVWLYPESQIAF